MITKKINKHIVKIYDSIEELPIINFQKYNKFVLIHSIIGNDISDIDNHILKISTYIQKKQYELAVKQLDNMRSAMYLITQEISPKYLAFASLIASIDGKVVTDISDSNLTEILNTLNTERKSVLDSILLQFKKKVDTELNTYFPRSQNLSYTKELYTKLKKKVLLELDDILENNVDYDEIDKLNEELLLSNKPKVFSGPDSFEIKNDKQFNELCLIIAKNLNVEVKKLTVFEFYNAIEYLEKENNPKVKK